MKTNDLIKVDLKNKIIKLRRQLDALEEKEHEEKFSKLVGKYFKYKNCYSLPRENEYFWLYFRVDKISGHSITGPSIQIDFNKNISFEPKKMTYGHLSGWIECSKADFMKEIKRAKGLMK